MRSKNKLNPRAQKKASTDRRVQVSVTIDPQVISDVDVICDEHNISRSEFFETAVKMLVEQNKMQDRVLSDPDIAKAMLHALSTPGIVELYTEEFAKRAGADKSQMMFEALKKAAGGT